MAIEEWQVWSRGGRELEAVYVIEEFEKALAYTVSLRNGCGVFAQVLRRPKGSVLRSEAERQAAWFDSRFEYGLMLAREFGHDLEPDAPSFSVMSRQTCQRCGRSVLGHSSRVYGSAIEGKCLGGEKGSGT